MDHLVLYSFGSELTKTAISARLVLAALKRRAATKGVRVAPKMMQAAEQAAATGMKSTPASVRRTALGAAESAQLSRKSQTLAVRSGVAPQRAALRIRGQNLDKAMAEVPKNVTSRIEGGAMLSRGLAPAAKNYMAGTGTLSQARSAAPVVDRGIKATVANTAGTGLGKRPLRAAASTPAIGTAATQLATRPLMPQTGRTISGPAMAWQKTMLAPRPTRRI